MYLRKYLSAVYDPSGGERRQSGCGAEHSCDPAVFRLCRDNGRICVSGFFAELPICGISGKRSASAECGNVCADSLYRCTVRSRFPASVCQSAELTDFWTGPGTGRVIFKNKEFGSTDAGTYLVGYIILLVGADRIEEIWMTAETSIYACAKQNLKGNERRTALWFYGKRVTFDELFEKIDAVAGGLYEAGVRQGSVVSVHMPNCPQAVYAVYAAAKLGAVCNLVHPQMPLEALKANMKETGSRILLTTDCFRELESVDFAERIFCGRLNAHMGVMNRAAYAVKFPFSMPEGVADFSVLERADAAKAVFPSQEELAGECVCYMHSSGTTGEPKIVMHSHRALNHWVGDAMEFFCGESFREDVCLTVLPMFHGSGLVLNVHQFIVHKGTQILMAKFHAKEAVRLIRRHKITSLVGVPAMYRMLLEEKDFGVCTGADIRQCYVSGEVVPPDLKREWDNRLNPSGKKHFLFEGYGMTETVSACFSNSERRYDTQASGFPLPHCHAAVWKNGKLYRDGTEGELAVSTNTMMMGYLNAPEDTKAAFFEQEGRIWLKTGDLGKVTEEGAVYFLERSKNVIIRNGYNIYPGEVENCLARIPFVRQVCVVGAKNEKTGSQCVRAYISLKERGRPEEEVRAYILDYAGKRLFRQAVPEEICFREELPVNRMGKIDRRKLTEE